MPPAVRVLCVDDEDDNNFIFKANFSRNFDVATCTSGIEALALVAVSAPHIIVTDLRMPGMGGIGLLERVLLEVSFSARVDAACAEARDFVEGVDRTIEKYERYKRGQAV